MNEFKQRLEKITLKNLKKTHDRNKHWPIEKKIEAVSQWLVLGNLRMVAASIGVSYELIRQWKIQPWWNELVDEIRTTEQLELDTKLSKIAHRSLDVVVDRLENGDFIYDQKTGEIKRKPVNMKDAAKVSTDVLTKRELLRGNATSRAETTQVSIQEQLALLAQEFAKMQIAKKDKPIELVEVEDAIYTEVVEQS